MLDGILSRSRIAAPLTEEEIFEHFCDTHHGHKLKYIHTFIYIILFFFFLNENLFSVREQLNLITKTDVWKRHF